MKFLIISSYDDFHYLKRAMATGVLDYLLKTDINPTTLTQKLLEVRDQFSSENLTSVSGIGYEIERFMSPEQTNAGCDNSMQYEGFPHLSSIKDKHYYFILCGCRHFFARDSKAGLTEWRNYMGDILRDVYKLTLNYDVFPIVCRYETLLLIGLSEEMLTHFGLKDFSNSLLYHFGSSSPLLQFYLMRPMNLEEFRRFALPLIPLINYHLYFLPDGNRPVDLDDLAQKHYVPISRDFPYHALILGQDHQEENILLIKNYIEACEKHFDIHTLEMFFRNFCVHLEILTNNQMKLPDTLFAQSPEIFKKWVYNRLEECILFLSGGMNHTSSPPVENAIRFMLQHYQEPDISSAEIASASGLSVNRLGILIKQETGKTLNEYLAQIRIEKAIELLEKTNLKIYEVSERCGYKTSQYFSQVFFQKTGHKPLDYRRGRVI